MLARHNGIANVVAALASASHLNVAHEFAGRQMATDMQRARAADHQRPIDRTDDADGVPDLVITGAGFGVFVDVAVSHPAAASYAQRAMSRERFGFVADQRAVSKHQKYDAQCEAKGLRMVPFCLESFGVLHGEAVNLLEDLAMNAEVGVRAALLLHARISLSFALQRGNALISLKGLSLLRARVASMPNRRVVLH